MTKIHNYYLNLAFQLAEKNLGKTGLNPVVGSVVVKNNAVISTGITSLKGRPHSEFNALSKIKNTNGATLYTTLEPCTHYGKTPPCTNIIIKKKIKNVYFSFEDPDLRTFKNAKKKLNEKGISVTLIKSKKYKNFYKGYFINKKKKIPFVSAKIALSKDFLTINKKNKWITDHLSRNIVHLLRSKHDCIISTSKSINADNSRLNCRLDGFSLYSPDLFIVDLNLRIKKNLLLNKLLRKRKTYLIVKKDNIKKTQSLKKLGYRILPINSLSNKNDFLYLFKIIYKMGYSRIFSETGSTFLYTLIKNKLINNLYIFQNNNKLGNNGKNNFATNYLKKNLIKSKIINFKNDKLFIKEFINV